MEDFVVKEEEIAACMKILTKTNGFGAMDYA